MNPFTIRKLIEPRTRYIWAQVRILQETDKAILLRSVIKTWIPKSQIFGIRLRKGIFEVYVKESAIG